MRERFGCDRHALSFPHVVVGDRIKINPGPAYGANVGDILKIQVGRWRWRRFRIVNMLDDGCVLVRRSRWYDPLRIFVLAALGLLPRADR